MLPTMEVKLWLIIRGAWLLLLLASADKAARLLVARVMPQWPALVVIERGWLSSTVEAVDHLSKRLCRLDALAVGAIWFW